jgi:oligoribonuclease NrnB/cAMP/cGMP phosphodiesterase (DHH superfamily)
MDINTVHHNLKDLDYDLNKIDHVVYHRNCIDGFCSAWIVWQFLRGSATYQGVMPDKMPEPSFYKKKYVIFVDISMSVEYLNKVKEVATHVLLIDHHQTYASDITKHPNAIIDLEHSAAYITWRVFNTDQKIPQFIRYIEDSDMGLNQLSKTEAFISALGTKLPFHHIDHFNDWNKLNNPAFVQKLIDDGFKYLEYKNYLLRRNMHITVEKKFGPYKVAVGNFGAVGLASDLANKISDNNSQCDFVILWSYHYNTNEHSIMMRTKKDNIDLSEIAKKYQGGGHPKAARFAWKGTIQDLWKDLANKLKGSRRSKKTMKKSIYGHNEEI